VPSIRRFRKGDAITAECFSQLTEAQRHVLGCCAVQQDGGHHPRTLAKLVEFGMLEVREVLVGYPPMTTKRHDVPLYVHMLWCEWCSDNVTEEEMAMGPDAPE
jgi:hypothetical protein